MNVFILSDKQVISKSINIGSTIRVECSGVECNSGAKTADGGMDGEVRSSWRPTSACRAQARRRHGNEAGT